MQKGFSWLIILIIGLLLIGGGVAGYIILSKPKFPIYASPLPVITSDQPSPEPQASSVDETAAWKTYTNTKQGYSIKYPSDKFINCSKDDFFLFKGGENDRECGLGEENTEFYIINKHTKNDYKATSDPSCLGYLDDRITIDYTEAIKYSYVFNGQSTKCDSSLTKLIKDNVYIIFNHGGYPYEIFYNSREDFDTKINILSTFRLLK